MSIALTNLRRLVRQPLMLFTTLALPFMIIVIVGVALGGSESEFRLGVTVPDGDAAATQFRTALDASDALETVSYAAKDDLQRAVRRGQVSAGIVVQEGYSAALEAGTGAALDFVVTPDQADAAALRAVVSSVVLAQVEPVQAAVFSVTETGRSFDPELARATINLPGVTSPEVAVESLLRSDGDALGFDYTAPSNLVLFVIITSLTSAGALVETRVRGVTRRMLVAPVGRTTIVLGEFLGRFIVAAAQALVILAVSTLAFGVPWGDPAGVTVVTLLLCAVGASLGLLLGFVARSSSQAVAFGPPLGIALGMLGGCMWPLSIVGDIGRQIGHIAPHAWAMDAYLDLINRSASLTDVLPQVGALSGFALGLLCVALLVVRREVAR